MREAWVIDVGEPVDHDLASTAMHDLARARLDGTVPDAVVLLEHPPVFTAGRRAREDELVWSEVEIDARGATLRRIDRGGSFTFHGPGQLVVYPVMDLGVRPDAGKYLRSLEEVVIRAGRDVGVALTRRPDVQTGVWAGDEKVCAIGIRLLRARVSLHGFALNCDVDLSWFDGIVPCGLPDHRATSLSSLAGRRIGPDDVRPSIRRHLSDVFDLTLREAPADVARGFRARPVGAGVRTAPR